MLIVPIGGSVNAESKKTSKPATGELVTGERYWREQVSGKSNGQVER
jgi:hypothetical protein